MPRIQIGSKTSRATIIIREITTIIETIMQLLQQTALEREFALITKFLSIINADAKKDMP